MLWIITPHPMMRQRPETLNIHFKLQIVILTICLILGLLQPNFMHKACGGSITDAYSQWGVVPEGKTDTDLNVNVEKTLMLVVIDIGWVDGGIYNVLWRADKSTANHIVFQVSSLAIGGYGYVAFCRLPMS